MPLMFNRQVATYVVVVSALLAGVCAVWLCLDYQVPGSKTSEAASSTLSDAKEAQPDNWKTYTNSDVGVSFSYPAFGLNDGDWQVANGTTGQVWQATIKLESGAVIYAYATTADFSNEEDGFPVWTRGFEIETGSYYEKDELQRVQLVYPVDARPAGYNFSPSDSWILSGGGQEVPVLFGSIFDKKSDNAEPAIRVLVNLKGPKFTGVGFVLFNMDASGSRPASNEDIESLKEIVTSVKFVLPPLH